MPKSSRPVERTEFGRRLFETRTALGYSQTFVGEKLGISQGTVSELERVGVGSAYTPQFAALYGINPVWLADGTGPKEPHPQLVGTQVGGGQGSRVGHPVSFTDRRVQPNLRTWESLMQGPLESEFRTTMPDASMAPAIRRGAVIEFITGVDPEPGDLVLVADKHEQLYLREYKHVRPGLWEAHAFNDAYLPMHSERDGLRVLAVFNGVLGRWSQK